jgi:hypothetical protein
MTFLDAWDNATPTQERKVKMSNDKNREERLRQMVDKSENGLFTMVARDQLDVVEATLDDIEDFLKELSRRPDLKQANEEVWAMAQLLEEAIPDDARAGVIINALSYMLSTQVIGQAVSDDAAKKAIWMVARYLIENTDAMIDGGHGRKHDA